MQRKMFSKELLKLFGSMLIVTVVFQVIHDFYNPNLFIYTRHSFLSYPGAWQWLTSNLVHHGWMHWFLNMLNLFAIVFLFPNAWSTKRFAVLFGFLSLGVTSGMFWLSPDIDRCAGMSGVLYGLVLYGALRSFSQDTFLSSIALIYVIGKLFADKTVNHYMGVDVLLGEMPVALDAHIYGAALGLVAFFLFKNTPDVHEVA
jgi:rhomboid family GlyGly-CTERM serine protease